MVALTAARRGLGRSVGLLRAVAGQQLAAKEPALPTRSRCLRVLESAQGTTVQVADSGAPYRMLNFTSANYLGLTERASVSRASAAAAQHSGATGTQRLHRELEQKVSEFHGREAAIVYHGDWDASVGLFSSLLSADDTVLADARSSPQTQAAITLCAANRRTYKNMQELEGQLIAASGSRLRVIAAEGVFESDVSLAELPRLLQLAEQHNACVVLDEAHAAGVIGSTGRGTEELFGLVNPELVVINGSLSTALGGAGGSYTAGPAEVIDLLRQTSKPYLSAGAMAPPVTAAVTRALELLQDPEEGSDLLRRLHANTLLLQGRLSQAGLTLGGHQHPLCHVLLPSWRCARTFADDLFKLGVLVDQPPSAARPAVRAVVTASHTRGQLHCAANAFYTVAQQMALVPQSPLFQLYTRRNPDYMDFEVDEILQC